MAYLTAGVGVATKLTNAFLKDLESTAEGQEIFNRYQQARAKGGQKILEEGLKLGYYNAHNALVAMEIVLGASMRLRRAEFLARADMTLEQAMEEAYNVMLYGLIARPKQRPALQATKRPHKKVASKK